MIDVNDVTMGLKSLGLYGMASAWPEVLGVTARCKLIQCAN